MADNLGSAVAAEAPPDLISILSWNCRELGNSRTVNALKRALKKQAPLCVFLMETTFYGSVEC